MLVRMDNTAAGAYAHHGAGRSSQLARLAREIRGREIAAQCTVVVLHIAGVASAVADAFPVFQSCSQEGIRSRLERNCDSKAAILLSKPTDGFPLLGPPDPFKLVITLFR